MFDIFVEKNESLLFCPYFISLKMKAEKFSPLFLFMAEFE